MKFMLGPNPIRRTVEYLTKGCDLVLRPQIEVLTLNYSVHQPRHQGARDFAYWKLPQVQYKNPTVQIATLKNMTPSPFFRAYFSDHRQMIIDVENKTQEEIVEHLIRVLGKPKQVLEAEALASEKKENPANFGIGCDRGCICVVPGQVPCSAAVKLPATFRGKVQQRLAQEGKL